MMTQMKKMTAGNRPVIITCIIYTVSWLLIVISAWLTGLHRYDLSKTISAYIGLRKWTVIFYFISATIMFTLLMIYVFKTKMPLVKKIVYDIVFFCVWGCSIFPSNREWSETISSIHLACAYGLMFSASFSFLLTFILASKKSQQVFAICTFIYAIFFIASLLVMKWNWFNNTLFLWENLCIYLLLIELLLEASPDQKMIN